MDVTSHNGTTETPNTFSEGVPVLPIPPSPTLGSPTPVAVAPPVKRGPGRPPLDPAKRQERAQKSVVRRELEKLREAKTVEELYAKAEALRGRKSAQTAPPIAAAPLAPPVPRWEDPKQVEPYVKLMDGLWNGLNGLLSGTRYELKKGAAIIVETNRATGEQTEKQVVIDQPGALAQGTAPLACKWLPDVATTPEAAAVLCVAMVFGPPALAHAKEAATRWYLKRKLALAQEHERLKNKTVEAVAA